MSEDKLRDLFRKGWVKRIGEKNNRVFYERPDGTCVFSKRDLRGEEIGQGDILFPGRGRKRGHDTVVSSSSKAVPPGPSTGPSSSPGSVLGTDIPPVSSEVEVETQVIHRNTSWNIKNTNNKTKDYVKISC